MEKDIIKNISIEDFKTNKNFVDYIDDDFLVANSLENIPYSIMWLMMTEGSPKIISLFCN